MNRKLLNRMASKKMGNLPARLEQGQRRSSGFARRASVTFVGDMAESFRGAKVGERVSPRIHGVVTSVSGSDREKPNVTVSVDEVEK